MSNNDKLILSTTLIRKESEFRTKSCVVEKAIAVSSGEFEYLKRHPLRENRLIAENADLMYCDSDNNYHCLLIYDEEQGDGLLIESEGTSSLKRFQNWGIVCAGVCLTAPVSEYRSPEEGCFLSDILETDVPPKYYLSDEAMRKMAEKENLNS